MLAARFIKYLLKITWKAKTSYLNVFRESLDIKKTYHEQRKEAVLIFFGNTLGRVQVKNLTTGNIYRKRNNLRQREKIFDSLWQFSDAALHVYMKAMLTNENYQHFSCNKCQEKCLWLNHSRLHTKTSCSPGIVAIECICAVTFPQKA